MYLIRLTGLIISLIFFTSADYFSQDDSNKFRIGMVFDCSGKDNSKLVELFKSETIYLTQGEYEVEFLQDKIIEADNTKEGIRSALNKLYTSENVDIVIAMGLKSSYIACSC